MKKQTAPYETRKALAQAIAMNAASEGASADAKLADCLAKVATAPSYQLSWLADDIIRAEYRRGVYGEIAKRLDANPEAIRGTMQATLYYLGAKIREGRTGANSTSPMHNETARWQAEEAGKIMAEIVADLLYTILPALAALPAAEANTEDDHADKPLVTPEYLKGLEYSNML